MAAEFQEYLAILDTDPGNPGALSALAEMSPTVIGSNEAAGALDAARKNLRERGQLEIVAKLFDVEINAAQDDTRRADLWLEKGHFYVDDLLEGETAVECFTRVLELRPNDETAQETIAAIDMEKEHWQKFVEKYLDEAKISTERDLTTSLYLRAAETYARYRDESETFEGYLRKALDVDARNRRAALHLERLLRRQERWEDLRELLEQRVDAAATQDERVNALLGLADLARDQLDKPSVADEAMKKVIALDATHPRALRTLADSYEAEEDWSALVMLYTNGLKAQRRSGNRSGDVGMLLQIGMLHWRRLDNLDDAEEYFRRIRKLEPGHPAALEFYRAYYPSRNESAKLLQILRQAQKGLGEDDAARKRALSVEMAEVAETQLGNPEKAIDAWKSILRADSGAVDARQALQRLYTKTEKWNALLDMMKDEVEHLPADEVAGRVERLMRVVEIYRDRLKLDVMVINTYNSILKIDPTNRQALDDLAEKYKQLGRWNDLINALGRKAEIPDTPVSDRVDILREVADLWSDRFGNYAQAIKPLEKLLELAPHDGPAIERLKEIYTRRRQWRALIALLGREVEQQDVANRREPLAKMAKLASDRLGDYRLAIEVWNHVLELPDHDSDSDALGALANLYEREKRYLSLVEILGRQRVALGDDPEQHKAIISLLERKGAILADRLGAPGLAAEAFQEILRVNPSHGRSLRTLRELYASAGDYDALESLYAELGAWDDLVDSFHAIADRLDDAKLRLQLLERSADIAAEHFDNSEKVARAYERVLSAEPKHQAAATALVPIYQANQKWARLLSSYEILLENASSDDERLELHGKILTLCEEHLGSKALAFQWAARAYELRPTDQALLADLQRLAADADAWAEAAEILDRRVASDEISDEERLGLTRELGKITMQRLHEPERAREYQRRVLELAADDVDAMAALEEIATQLSEWPDLLEVYRRRVDLEEDEGERVELLFKIAFIEEERLADLDAAAKTYGRVLEIAHDSRRAMRALAKLQEARGDWQGLAKVLEAELEHTVDAESRVGLHLRLGGLYENNLRRHADALRGYQDALELEGHKAQLHVAIERFLVAPTDGSEQQGISSEDRVVVAGLLLPAYEQADEPAKIARAIEVLRDTADDYTKLDYDRRLAKLYGERLGETERAFAAGVRVLQRDPSDAGNRTSLLGYSTALERNGALADVFEEMLAQEDPPDNFDGVTQRALAAQLAMLYEEHLDQPDRAESAWLRVLSIEPTDALAYDALDRIYRSSGRWADLRDLLLRREENTLDGDRRKDILLSICDLEEGVLDNAEGAVRAFIRVLEIDPEMERAYKALERLYENTERWTELEDLLGRELDYAEEKAQTELIYRRARIRAQQLENPSGAVDLLEEVVSLAPGHTEARELLEELLPNKDLRLRVARILEPLYNEDGLWRDLVLVLRAQRESAGAPQEAVDLLARIAGLEEEHVGNERAAFETWVDALSTDPGDERPRREINRLASQLDRWEDAAAAYELALESVDAGDLSLRADLLGEAALIYDQHLADTERGMTAYKRLLDVDPHNPDTARKAAVALDRLYLEEQRWPDLIDIIRRQADWSDTADERKELLARIAVLHEDKLDDTASAVTGWREVLGEDPEDPGALDALERLYLHGGKSLELVEILRRRVEMSEDANAKRLQLQRIAALHEEALDSRSDAITAHLEVLDHLPDDRQTLVELARLYRADQRWIDLMEVTERRLASCEEETERLELTSELATLLHKHLGREAEALERFAEVLTYNPRHIVALTAIESMVDDQDLRPRSSEILQPLYQSAGEYTKLSALLLKVADNVDEPRERLHALRQVAQIRESFLEDPQGAFEVQARAVRAAVAEVELDELVTELVRLAAVTGQQDALIDIYKDIVPDILDGDLQRKLRLELADLALALREDATLARDFYQRVLDTEPDDRHALGALENIYREAAEYERLNDILARKAELNEDDLDVRVAALSESARLCSEHLKRPEDAVLAWEQVLEIAPETREAADDLEKLYSKADRHHDLVELLERRLGYAFTVEEAVDLRYRLGGLYETQLLDPDRAVENYSAALGGDPSHAGATGALERFLDDPAARSGAAEVLEPIYVATQDWPKLVRIYEIKLEAAEMPTERLQLTRYIARLYEDQLEDLEGAFRWYGRVFRENPGDVAVRDQLTRLATVLEDWGGLANVYQDYLDDEGDESPAVREVALALADICHRRTKEIERGLAAYRRVMQIMSDDLESFAKMEAMLIGAERWYALVDVYEDAVQATMDDAWRIELYTRQAAIHEQHLNDIAKAIDAHRAVLDIDQDFAASVGELDRLFQAQNQWFELAELLNTRVERSLDESEANTLRIRLADVMETRLDDANGAIDHYEVVLKSGVGWEAALVPLERLVVGEDHRERIAGLLEPVYRTNDWWQKLVVILDAQLAFIEDPERRVDMLREIARIHEGRGGDQGLALEALSRAWKESPSHQEVYGELSALASKLAAWDQLVATLEEGIREQYDYDLVAAVWGQIAEIQETRRNDNPKAVDAWRKVLEVRDDDPVALTSLDRLLDVEQRYPELVSVIERRAELADDQGVRKVMLHRIAEIHEATLQQTSEAITAYKNVLGVDESDAAALDALERLYRGEEEWNELATILARKIELADDPATQRPLRFAAAEVHDKELKDAYEAIAQLNAVLEHDPNDVPALVELDLLYAREKMWPELLETLDRRAELESDTATRAGLAFRAAEVVQVQIVEPENAIARYAGVLQLEPSHDGARQALDAMTGNEDTLEPAAAVLEQLYRAESAHENVAELYERRLAVQSHDPDVRRQQYIALVEIHEIARGDLDAAFLVWARALAETPEDDVVLGQLERLAASRGSWQELADLYEERLGDIVDAELEYLYATKLAQLYEQALGDLDKAADRYRKALEVANEEAEALAALDRIYGRAGKFKELAEILAREAEATMDEAAQAEFLFRLGDLRETNLADLAGAVSAHRDVLERAPQHAAARGALDRLLQSAEEQRSEIVSILEPLYESEADWGRLADLLATKLSITTDHLDRSQLYQRIAELAERQLSDPVRALDAAGGWLAEDPLSEQALAELERLATVVNRWGEVAARLSGIIGSANNDDIKRALSIKLGEVQLYRLGDADQAEVTLKGVLELDPEQAAALASLERIYRERGDGAALADVLWRSAQVTYEPDRKRACFVEVAGLREQLGDLDGAVTAWKEVLDLDEGDKDAHGRLAAIYQHTEQWKDLIEVLGLSARFAGDPKLEREYRSQIAQIYTSTLGDMDGAVEAWQSVLDVAPDAQDALLALEHVHTQREDWLAVQEILVRRLDAADGQAERIGLMHQLAQLAFDKQESPDDAMGYYFQVLDLDNAHFETYAALEALLTKAERWHDLVELLERLGDVKGTLGDSRGEIECLARAADVWEGALENPDAAGDILEKILTREPNYVPALTRLAKIYENAGDWEKCGQTLQKALQLGPQGSDAADLYFRLGEVERQQSGDIDQALRYWSQALGYDAQHGAAIKAVEDEARNREDWGVVADMVTRREMASTDAGEKLDLTLELADLYGSKLGQPDAVIPLLERAVQVAPEDARVLGPLADLYFTAGRHVDAAPIYERLADEAKKKRKMKDVAKYRQRLGGIFEAQGDVDKALAAYEEAFRVNPTHVPTMAGLGRIYLTRSDWEKARRVFRSMVLQNLDPSVGITKAEVYFNLGVIHMNLNENNKAKGMFQRGLELEPDNAQIKQALEGL